MLISVLDTTVIHVGPNFYEEVTDCLTHFPVVWNSINLLAYCIHHAKMEVKTHKTYITVNIETYFALNY